jgi:hypothetical protein
MVLNVFGKNFRGLVPPLRHDLTVGQFGITGFGEAAMADRT